MRRLVLPLLMYKESGKKKEGGRKKHWVVPTWNHLYTVSRNKVFLDEWALEHKEKIVWLSIQWKRENRWKTTYNRKVFVDMWIYWPDARKRDCGNIDKIILDAFEEAGIYDDDSNALPRYQDFDIDLENPRIEVEFVVGESFDRVKRAKELKKEMKKKKRRMN